MPSVIPQSWNVARARSYVVRLPLLTRGFAVAIVVFWIAGLQGIFDVRAWGNLDPAEVGFGTCRFSLVEFWCVRGVGYRWDGRDGMGHGRDR